MKAVGIIVEYNPFHNGHLLHLKKSLQITSSDAVIAVMSGHFLQRGEPALVDKWTRTEMALQGGCDLVIELPTAYATSSAQWFAYGAVSLLEATGVCQSICFGTESGNLAPLQHAAKLLAKEPPAFQQLLKDNLSIGMSYPKAYSNAVTVFLQDLNIAVPHDFRFDLPNHTLGLHYLLALEVIKSSMVPFTIPREKAQYHDTQLSEHSIASATAIRKLLFQQHDLPAIASYVPDTTMQLLSKFLSSHQSFVNWENFSQPLFHALAVQPKEQIATYREIQEGLEHRLSGGVAASVEQFIQDMKSKRYTVTKIQRALLSITLNHLKHQFTKDQLYNGVTYIRVLGFTSKGRQLLKEMKEKASLPVLLSAARAGDEHPYLPLDISATAAYMLALPHSSPEDRNRDYTEKPIIV